ncbi:helix-turn-helix transcriptional regulator [Actinomadura oligospora]|uniref:helix-turn-helix transcriptional regulator n=1 Tax=Actinomadura oligospora TaxID=111804 RepID=UPI00047EEA12|nr:helix-turn-helix transcriptional regulator [Actinomadura oligospora]
MTMVEREFELTALRDDFARALDGQGRVVIIDGAAATGKTTLLRAFGEHAAATGALVLEAAGTAAGQNVTLAVLRQLVRGVGAPPGMSEEALWLLEDGLLGTAFVPGSAGGTGTAEAPDAPFGTAMARELAAVLLGHAETRPLVLLVDDAHAADGASLHWLAHLAHRLRTSRITLVLAATTAAGSGLPHLQAELLRRPYCRRLRLRPLSRRGQERLLAERVGAEAAARLAARCDELSGGNPLLVDALLKDGDATLRNTGDLTADAAYTRAVVYVLRRAGVAASRVAKAMAVLTCPGTPALVARVLGEDPADLADAFDHLRGAGLCTEDGFRTPAIRAAVLDAAPSDDLTALHRSAASVLHEDGATASEVAGHLVAVNEPPRPWAAEILLTAAEQAVAAGDPRFAVACLRLARWGVVTPREGVRIAELLAAVEWRTDPAVAARLLPELGAGFQSGLLAEPGVLTLARHLAWAGRRDDAARALARSRPARFAPGRLVREAAATRLLLATAFPGVANRLPATPPNGLVDGRPAPRSNGRPGQLGDGRLDGRADGRPDGRPDGWPVAGDLEVAGAAASGPLRAAAALAAVLSDGTATGAAFDPVAVAQEVLAGAQPPTWSFEYVVAAASALVYAERPALAADWCDALLEREPGWRAPAERAALTVIQAVTAMRGGDLRAADQHARAALAWTSPLGWGVAIGVPISVTVLATTAAGRLEEAATHLGVAVPEAMFETLAGLHYLHARGRYHLASGRPRTALADFLACGDRMTRWGCDVPGLVPWRVEAAWARLALGDRDEAAALARRQLALAGPGPSRARGAGLRVLASAADPVDRPGLLAEAVRVLEQGDDRCELALALGELGQALDAVGRHQPARVAAQAAERVRRQCGLPTPPAGTGASPGTGDRTPQDAWTSGSAADGGGEERALTEAERKVAELAVEGRTNREIGEALRVTVSTVEQHLTRVYRKLAVSRRSELRTRLRPASPEDN